MAKKDNDTYECIGGADVKTYKDATVVLVDLLNCMNYERQDGETAEDFRLRVLQSSLDQLKAWPDKFRMAVFDKTGIELPE